MGTAAGFSQRRQIADADAEAEDRRLHVTRPEYWGGGLLRKLRSVSLVGIRSTARTGDRRGNLKARQAALKVRHKKWADHIDRLFSRARLRDRAPARFVRLSKAKSIHKLNSSTNWYHRLCTHWRCKERARLTSLSLEIAGELLLRRRQQ